MTKFTTRVELHDADWSEYSSLHAQMHRQGFTNTVTSGDGKLYELPPAEYNYEGTDTRSQVLDKAKAAATAVKKSFAIIVTESAGRTWEGLSPA